MGPLPHHPSPYLGLLTPGSSGSSSVVASGSASCPFAGIFCGPFGSSTSESEMPLSLSKPSLMALPIPFSSALRDALMISSSGTLSGSPCRSWMYTSTFLDLNSCLESASEFRELPVASIVLELALGWLSSFHLTLLFRLDEELPPPQGEGKWSSKSSTIFPAMYSHIFGGYAAKGALLCPPWALRPYVFRLCLCPQLLGSGPIYPQLESY